MLKRVLKVFLAMTTLCLIAVVSAPFFIPQDSYHELVESIISEGIERDVKIAKIKYQLYPLPHIEADNIAIASNKHPGDAHIGQAAIWLSYKAILEGKVQIDHVHFSNVKTNEAFLNSFTKTSKTESSQHIHLKRISAANVSVQRNDNATIGPFDFDMLSENNEYLFSTLDVTLRPFNLNARISPLNAKQYQIKVTGENVSLPSFKHLPELEHLKASAVYLGDYNVDIKHFHLQAKGLDLSGQMQLKHTLAKQWLASGALNFKSAQLALFNPFLVTGKHRTKVNGLVSANVGFTSLSPTLENLPRTAITQGKFMLKQASLHSQNVDLHVDTASGSAKLDKTGLRFDDVSGTLYGGSFVANDININWHKQWRIGGHITPEDIDFAQLSHDLFKNVPLAGKASGHIKFLSTSAKPEQLIQQLKLTGDLAFSSPNITFTNEEQETVQLNGFNNIAFNKFTHSRQQFTAQETNINGYDGSLHASNLTLSWLPTWYIDAQVTTNNLSLAPLIEQLTLEKSFLSGLLSSSFEAKGKADTLPDMIAHLETSGQFTLNDAVLYLDTTEQDKYFTFQHAHTSASMNAQQLLMKTLDVNAYDGTLEVRDFHLSRHDNEWALFTKVRGLEVSLEPMLSDVTNQRIIAGKASGHARLALNGPELDRLLDNIDAQGKFYVSNGAVYNTDIEEAVAFKKEHATNENETTDFTDLSSEFSIANNTVKLKKLAIISETLQGQGDVTILPSHELKGSLDVAVRSTGNLLQVPLNVAGTIDEPQFALTGGALVGGAVGTSVLGPGLGTYIGLQTGRVFSGIGSLFTRDENN